MKKKILIFLFLLITHLVSTGQVYDCQLILSAINDNNFKTEFKIKDTTHQVIIYDKNKEFINCSINSKIYVLSTDSAYYHLHPEKKGNQRYPNLIVLYKVEKLNRRFKLFFWHPYSGANFIIQYKKRRNKYKYMDYSVGVF